jgi:hypothetical protein
MRTTMSKLASVMYLSTILLIGMGLLLGCGTASAPDEQDASEIRRPAEGEDLEAFWDEFDWTDLTPAEQALWRLLGWDEASWQGEADEPASESKDWSELTNEERSAAEQLGYDETYWDSLLANP